MLRFEVVDLQSDIRILVCIFFFSSVDIACYYAPGDRTDFITPLLGKCAVT